MTGPIFLKLKSGMEEKYVSLRLQDFIPVTNYDGSMSLNFYHGIYDRPGDSPTWYGPYNHVTSSDVIHGNEEFVTVSHDNEARFHQFKIEGPNKDEAFQIEAIRPRFSIGSMR